MICVCVDVIPKSMFLSCLGLSQKRLGSVVKKENNQIKSKIIWKIQSFAYGIQQLHFRFYQININVMFCNSYIYKVFIVLATLYFQRAKIYSISYKIMVFKINQFIKTAILPRQSLWLLQQRLFQKEKMNFISKIINERFFLSFTQHSIWKQIKIYNYIIISNMKK